MYIIADMLCYLDEFPPNIDEELHLLILHIPEEKFTEEMDEYEDFEPNAPGVSLSQPIPTGWKYKAVKLPGEVAFVSEEFGINLKKTGCNSVTEMRRYREGKRNLLGPFNGAERVGTT